jgi:hypothetical protein
MGGDEVVASLSEADGRCGKLSFVTNPNRLSLEHCQLNFSMYEVRKLASAMLEQAPALQIRRKLIANPACGTR